MKNKLFICVLISLYLMPLSGYAIDLFTEYFSSGFDMDGHSVTFTPDESESGYSADVLLITELPTEVSVDSKLIVGHDDFKPINITDGKSVPFYGTNYTAFYIGSNGYITFGSGDGSYGGNPSSHFSQPRISGLGQHLIPNTSAIAGIYGVQENDRIVITFSNQRRYGVTGSSNTFQIEMFFDGRIRISWLGIDDEPFYTVIGLSAGIDIPPDSYLSDFTDYAVDLDLDGLPDSWERDYFGHRDNCIPDVDWDGDGYNNLAEYTVDTDPINPSSKGFRFEQEALPEVSGESRLVFNWTALEGREYTIRCADSLIFDDFSEVLQSGIAYPVNAYTTTVDQAKSSCFFKVDVQLAD